MSGTVSRAAAIYVQEFPDFVALDAVNEITSLTNGLSRNIWQKIMLLDRLESVRATGNDRTQDKGDASPSPSTPAGSQSETATQS